MDTIIVDIEADNFLDKVSTIWCIGISDAARPRQVQTYTDHDNQYPSLSEALERIKSADRVVGHNMIGYDWPVIEKFYPGTLTFDQLYDTMVTGALLDPQRGSINLASYGNELGYPKGDYNDFSRYCQEMVDYMERDVEITAVLYNQQIATLNSAMRAGVDYRAAMKLEHRVQHVLSLQMHNGVRLNVDKCLELEEELRKEVDQISEEVLALHPPKYRPEKADWCFKDRKWINVQTFTPKGDNSRYGYTAYAPMTKIEQRIFNPGSRPQIAQRLSEKYGWAPTKYTPGGVPSITDDTLAEVAADHPEANSLARYLTVSKQLGQLIDGDNGWLKKQQDGRVFGYVRSCGARTHRMSHSRPNLAQVMKKDHRMREVWEPEEGQVMVGVDADSLELRELACFLYPLDGGAYANAVLNGSKDDGTDAHSLNMKAAGCATRDGAKTFFYGMIYGAGDPKLGAIIVEDYRAAGLPRPSGTLTSIGKRARASLEDGITGLRQLVRAVKAAAKQKKFVRLSDGRPVKTSQRIALNSLLQGEGAVLMKQAVAVFHEEYMQDFWDQGVRYLLNVHDEVQFSAPPELAEPVGNAFRESIRLAGERLGLKVPFDGEYKIGANWSETH